MTINNKPKYSVFNVSTLNVPQTILKNSVVKIQCIKDKVSHKESTHYAFIEKNKKVIFIPDASVTKRLNDSSVRAAIARYLRNLRKIRQSLIENYGINTKT